MALYKVVGLGYIQTDIEAKSEEEAMELALEETDMDEVLEAYSYEEEDG